jgi:hypothetical protein
MKIIATPPPLLLSPTTSGGARKGAGRPPRAGEAADVRIMIRLTTSEHRELRGLAKLRGVSVAELLRDAGLRAARRGERS